MKICIKCGKSFDGNFCPSCGHPIKPKSINADFIKTQLGDVLLLKKGIFLTIKKLLITPGISVREYLRKDRTILMSPILFILITSLFYTLAINYFHIQRQYFEFERTDGVLAEIFIWIQDNYGYANILMSAFIALMLRFLFRKSGYNFYEILVLLCFVLGTGMLILGLFGIIQMFIHYDIVRISGFIFVLYLIWALADFFGKRKPLNYLKALFAYFGGLLFFLVTAVLTMLVFNSIF